MILRWEGFGCSQVEQKRCLGRRFLFLCFAVRLFWWSSVGALVCFSLVLWLDTVNWLNINHPDTSICMGHVYTSELNCSTSACHGYVFLCSWFARDFDSHGLLDRSHFFDDACTLAKIFFLLPGPSGFQLSQLLGGKSWGAGRASWSQGSFIAISGPKESSEWLWVKRLVVNIQAVNQVNQ